MARPRTASPADLPRASDRELNRWTLARQHLLARTTMGATEMVDHLCGMQAQHSVGPFVGLWSRIEGFDREELHAALLADAVVKCTAMRGTLHLVPGARLAHYRLAAGSAYFADAVRKLESLGLDVAAMREAILEAIAERPHTRPELQQLILSMIPDPRPAWADEQQFGLTSIGVAHVLVNVPEDAFFGWFGGSRYRVAPAMAADVDPVATRIEMARAYLAAFGPASPADLSQWGGHTITTSRPALEALDEAGELVRFVAADGRVLLDLASAPRPDPGTPAPVRFLGRWDNVLLSHDNRTRIIHEEHRKTVIKNNGDVAPTFLVDGMVAGQWDAPLRGKASLTLSPFGTLRAKDRKALEQEGARLLAWLRPDQPDGPIVWAS